MVTISKAALNQAGGVVILSVKEYRQLKENTVPVYYLKGKAARQLDNLVDQGLKEYKEGRTRTLKSLVDLE